MRTFWVIAHVILQFYCANNNLILTEREGRTGEYRPEVAAVRTEHSEVRTKTTEGQYSPVRLEQARLVSSLLCGTRTLNLTASKTKNARLMTVSMETVVAKSRPRKNQSERRIYLETTLPYDNQCYYTL